MLKTPSISAKSTPAMKTAKDVLTAIATRKKLTTISEQGLLVGSFFGIEIAAFAVAVSYPEGLTAGVLTIDGHIVTSDSRAFVELAVEAARSNPNYQGLGFKVRPMNPTCLKEAVRAWSRPAAATPALVAA